jgi:hypothetical protein
LYFPFPANFIPAVLMPFLVQSTIPGFNDDIGFTKANFILSPVEI